MRKCGKEAVGERIMESDWEEPMNVLLVEEKNCAQSFGRALDQVRNVPLRVEIAGTSGECLNRLDEGGIDAVVLNHSLREEPGVNILRQIRSKAPHVPVIVAADDADPDTIIAAVQHGAEDYVVKGHGDSDYLGHTLHYARQASTLRYQAV